jgi:ubiquinone/menaquinone biosynthesis C-methylase UbiE
MKASPQSIQREYYQKTASNYDAMHVASEDDEHYTALKFMEMLCDGIGITTLLDVGAGTGRGVRFFLDRGRDVRGIEPVPALIEQAEQRGIKKGLIVEGGGYLLPFEDRSFDAVFECGVLHHVDKPRRMVAEMMRVASKAVFISDTNRFGQGRVAARILKLLLYKTHLWSAARWIQTRGKMYSISEGDGLAYSYSVFDSYDLLATWADSIWLIPTSKNQSNTSWVQPLLTSPHVLLCAFKDRVPK